LRLPYVRPPLTLNQRLHWQAKRRLVANVRAAVRVLARSARIPALQRVEVELHYVPPDHRRRDGDNLTATSKPAVDGLVDAGVVPDDDPAHVVHLMPVIDPPRVRTGNPLGERLLLIVREVPPPEQLLLLEEGP